MKKSASVTPRVTMQRSLLSLAVASATLAMAPAAQAFQFNMLDGEVQGSFDTTLTYGALWRVTGQDPRLVAVEKGGTRNSPNYDNGNVNYDRGELVSSLFKMNNELELKYKNVGGFFRITSFYDEAIQRKNFDPELADKRTIRNRLGHDYEILDAYIFGNFAVGDRNLGVRLGKQVISLGESTFIPNGLNALNPVDVAKLRAPGAEIKDALLPTQMLQLSLDVTDNLSVDIINKFQFRESRPEPNGSYFSTNDFLSPGGSKVLIGGGNDFEGNPVRINRGQDREAKHTGQYALAARYLAPNLGNTEFGFFFANYHGQAPLIGGRTTSLTNTPVPALGGASTEAFLINQLINAATGGMGPGAAAIQGLFDPTTGLLPDGDLRRAQFGARALTSEYRAEYAEDIRMFGLSFNTLGPYGIAIQGEYSYRPNQPLNLVANNILNSLLLLNGSPFNTGIGNLNNQRNTDLIGYRRVKMHQAQMTATHLLGRVLGSDQTVGIVEVGYTHLDLPKGLDFNGPGVDFTTPFATNTSAPLAGGSSNGVLTKNSYGYRTVVRSTYQNAVGAVNLSPRIAFQHDMRGTSPTFTQKNKAITVGLTAEYQNKISADISYTNFFGGETIGETTNGFRSTNQQLADRDFIAATISYAF